MRVLRAAVAAVIVLLIVIFALSNRQPVDVGFWPTGYVWTVPLSLAVLAVAAVFFIGGALLGWAGAVSARRRARRAEAALRLVEAQRPVPTTGPLLAPAGT
jgi:lipopolysaccharide assembly protein A